MMVSTSFSLQSIFNGKCRLRLIVLLFHLGLVNPVSKASGALQSFDETVMASAEQTRELITRTVRDIIGGNDEMLIDLMEGEDTSLAVAAAWERVFQKMRRDPDVFGDFKRKADIQEFFNYMESKLDFEVPKHWRRVLETCSRSPTMGIVDFRKWDQQAFIAKNSYWVPRDHSLELNNGRLFVSTNSQWIELRSSKQWNGYPCIDVCRSGQFDFVAYLGAGHNRPPLECWNNSNGELVWRTRIFDFDIPKGGSVMGNPEWIELKASETVLTVFGMDTNGSFYVEVVKLETGEKEFMFYSEIWGLEALGSDLLNFAK